MGSYPTMPPVAPMAPPASPSPTSIRARPPTISPRLGRCKAMAAVEESGDGGDREVISYVGPRRAAHLSLVLPPRLHPGDTIRVIAPSGPVPRETLEAGAAVLAPRYRLRYDPATLFRAEGFL